jgi:cytidylate kinase
VLSVIISICGNSGSGKDTVGKELARRLGYKFYSVGGIRREMARKRGMTIQEFNKLGEQEEFTDKEPDQYQEELGKKEDDFVIVGRTSAHFIPHSFKVFLRVEPDEAAMRIFSDRDREHERYESLEDARDTIRKRDGSDEKRYRKYYGINPYDEKGYDLVIDTTNITAMEVVEQILSALRKAGKV